MDHKRLASGAATLILVELGILVGPAPIHVVAGMTLGLVLPGLVTARLLSGPLGRVEGLLLIPGMSLVVAVITGLLLDAADIRLTAENWAIALGVVSGVAFVAIVILDRDEQAASNLWSDSGRSAPATAFPDRWPRLRGAPSLMLATAVLAVGGSIAVSTLGEHYRGPGFTELWALPGRSSRSVIRLGVISHELHDSRYRIQVSIDGRVAGAEQIALRPGQAWQSSQSVTADAREVSVTLEKLPRGTMYRQVRLRIA